MERYVAQYQATKSAEKELKDKAAQIQALMGDAASLKGPGFRIDWKLTNGSTVTDYEAAFREAVKDNPGLGDELEQKHTRATQGSRRFVPYFFKSKGGGK